MEEGRSHISSETFWRGDHTPRHRDAQLTLPLVALLHDAYCTTLLTHKPKTVLKTKTKKTTEKSPVGQSTAHNPLERTLARVGSGEGVGAGLKVDTVLSFSHSAIADQHSR